MFRDLVAGRGRVLARQAGREPGQYVVRGCRDYAVVAGVAVRAVVDSVAEIAQLSSKAGGECGQDGLILISLDQQDRDAGPDRGGGLVPQAGRLPPGDQRCL
jgi:hypothetical protein